MSVNGSSATGNCSEFNATATHQQSRCDAPASSVLFDGNIPTLTELDEDMWASQLLTINTNSPSMREREISFDFTGKPRYSGVKRIELVMFNCPEWGIAIQTITLLTSQSILEAGSPINVFNVPITSCDSLVMTCISQDIEQQLISLQFDSPPFGNGVVFGQVGVLGTPC